MASDNRSITITLKTVNESDGGGQSELKEQTNTNTTSQKSQKGNTDTALAAYAATQIASTIMSEAVSWGNFAIDMHLMLTDNYIAQREKSIFVQQTNRAFSLVTSVRDSALQGFFLGGPSGAVLGAIFGTIQQGTAIARGNIQASMQQDLAIRQREAQLEFTRARAGWSTKAASIGEDL